MSIKADKSDPRLEAGYERGMLRSAFVSLFWSVISERKKRSGGYTLQALAQAVGSTKHEVSRWFNGDPNWTINTIANIARALELDITIQAREKATGRVFTPAGPASEPDVRAEGGDSGVAFDPASLAKLYKPRIVRFDETASSGDERRAA